MVKQSQKLKDNNTEILHAMNNIEYRKNNRILYAKIK